MALSRLVMLLCMLCVIVNSGTRNVQRKRSAGIGPRSQLGLSAAPQDTGWTKQCADYGPDTMTAVLSQLQEVALTMFFEEFEISRRNRNFLKFVELSSSLVSTFVVDVHIASLLSSVMSDIKVLREEVSQVHAQLREEWVRLHKSANPFQDIVVAPNCRGAGLNYTWHQLNIMLQAVRKRLTQEQMVRLMYRKLLHGLMARVRETIRGQSPISAVPGFFTGDTSWMDALWILEVNFT
nr:PREDICTED: uncharacterized protein LOC106704112 [Latimeria chalumnae]|eukprot:XP_014345897.1 PREDICTED: uncharacterized protein LOC106704112 [Latimeria chalumnae]